MLTAVSKTSVASPPMLRMALPSFGAVVSDHFSVSLQFTSLASSPPKVSVGNVASSWGLI